MSDGTAYRSHVCPILQASAAAYGTPCSLRCYRIQFLRDAKESFGTAFKIVPADPSDAQASDLLYSCYGIGYVNANRSLA